MNRFSSLLFFAVLALAISAGCEQERSSPPVTIGKASAPSPAAALPEPDGEVQNDREAETPVAAPTKSLPEGTEEQLDLLSRARIAFIADYQEIAEEYFYELATSEPITGATVSAAIALGQIYVESGRAEEALKLMDDLQDHAGSLPEVLLVTGRVYAALHEPMRALQAYDRALQAQKDYIFLFVDMAELLFQIDEKERANQLLHRYESRLAELAQVLESPEETTAAQRLYVLDIFSMVDDDRAHAAIYRALDDPSPQVRQTSIVLLATFRIDEARERLRALAIDDPDEDVRRAARASLESLSR